MHPLDRPVWNALRTRQAAFAEGGPNAVRMKPEYGPFGAAADSSPEALNALAGLMTGKDALWVVETTDAPALPGAELIKRAPCVQMLAAETHAFEPAFEVTPLTEADAPAMRALAELTQPGPFSSATHKLGGPDGGFIGVKHNGVLVAMAGERMKPEGFAEVSGVCTHPDHRGKGYAAGLMRMVIHRIGARGETAFLHAYATNTGAIALYETLGFRLRTTVILSVFQGSKADL